MLKVIFGCQSLDIQDTDEDKGLEQDCWDEYFSGKDILDKKAWLNVEKSYEENPRSKCQIYYFEDYR